MFHRILATPTSILVVASLLLNILIIGFGYSGDPVWFIALGFTIPLLWASLVEVARESRNEER